MKETLHEYKFGLGIILISERFTQCQIMLRNKLKNSSNQDIVEIYGVTKERTLHMISTNPPERQ